MCLLGRVYACSRFVHQVALSAVSGFLGLLLGWRISSYLDNLRMLIKHHIFGTTAVVIVAVRAIVQYFACGGLDCRCLHLYHIRVSKL